MIVATVILSILNQMELNSVQNRKENCTHDHIPFNVKGSGILVFSVCLSSCVIITDLFWQPNRISLRFKNRSPILNVLNIRKYTSIYLLSNCIVHEYNTIMNAFICTLTYISRYIFEGLEAEVT